MRERGQRLQREFFGKVLVYIGDHFAQKAVGIVGALGLTDDGRQKQLEQVFDDVRVWLRPLPLRVDHLEQFPQHAALLVQQDVYKRQANICPRWW